MTSADLRATEPVGTPGLFDLLRGRRPEQAAPVTTQNNGAAGSAAADTIQRTGVIADDAERKRERFIPVTRFALFERLSQPLAWPAGQGAEARRFFRYLDYWRQQQYNSRTARAGADLRAVLARQRSVDDARSSRRRDALLCSTASLPASKRSCSRPTTSASTRMISQLIMTRDSAYGLDLHVDMNAFDEIAIYYRGASNRKHERRRYKKFSAQGRVRRADLPAPVHSVQAEAVRRPRRGSDARGKHRSRNSRKASPSARASHPPRVSRTTTST